MERRGYGFYTKRTQHYDNLQQADSQHQKQPLKDATNTNNSTKQESESTQHISNDIQNQQQNQQQTNVLSNHTHQGSQSLQCLETLAQKAGIHDITPDDCKYDIAHTLLNLDRQNESVKEESQNHSCNMSEIKSQQQQIVDANAQAQAVQLQQVSMQQEQQTMVTSQSPHLQQVTVNASNGQLQASGQMGPPQHTVSIHQQVTPQGQVIQTQGGGQVLTTAQSGSTTITTMSPLQHAQGHPQQINADWGHGRAVQVIQQPTQNQMYLPQIYNTQGQLLMPLHTGINPQQIQVIAKTFQGNQLTPHMLTTAQGKQVIQGNQTATFPGYATIPTSQNQQTLVMGGQKMMQKVSTSSGVQTQQQQGQCVQVSQAMIGSQPTAQIISPIQAGGQPMQFAPWQFTNGIPQVWTTNGLQSQALLAPNPIFIRGGQPEGTLGPGIFMQQSPQATTIQTQQNPAITSQGTVQQITKPRTANDNIQPKQQLTSRPLLPSNANANIRPASSVSTQTIGAQTPSSMGVKPGTKIRNKAPQIRTSPAPKNEGNPAQIKPNYQQKQILIGNKIVVMNSSAGTTGTMQGSPIQVDSKGQTMQGKPQQISQVQHQQPQALLLQQQQQMQHQQQNLQQQVQQQMMLQHQQQQGQQQHIQPKPMMFQTIQGIQQQQIQMSGDRPIMPVVSMSQAGAHQVQQSMTGMQQGLPIQSNLSVTQQTMPMNVQQIQQLSQMAGPGTIIGQIQPTQGHQPTMAQVQPNSNHMHQFQQAQQQPQISISAPQQVILPPTVQQIKTECPVNNLSSDNTNSPLNNPQNMDISSKDNGVDTSLSSIPQEKFESQDLPIEKSHESNGSQIAPMSTMVTTQQHDMTITSGLPLVDDVKERCPPKAMVKPQVLTHVIEDFVIQESSEPFPVTRSSLICELKRSVTAEAKETDEPSNKKFASNNIGTPTKGDVGICEACGETIDVKSKFKKNKRFCSIPCSKSGKSGFGKKEQGMDMDEILNSGAENSLIEDDVLKVDPTKWTVQEVSDFIKNLTGCSEYAEDFLIQEIDGQALMLLKADHLMTAMNMKLGPALKIVAKIDDLRIEKEPPKQN